MWTLLILLVSFALVNANASMPEPAKRRDCTDPNNHVAEESKQTIKCTELSTYIVDRGFVPDMTTDFYQVRYL